MRHPLKPLIIALLLVHVQSARAEMVCAQLGLAAEQTLNRVWDLGHNSWASLWMPWKARKSRFNFELLDHSKNQFLEAARAGKKVVLPVNAEEKLGMFFGMMELKSDTHMSMSQIFAQLPAKRRKSVYKNIMSIMNDFTDERRILGFIPKWKMNPYVRENRILRIQKALFESFYPKMFEGVNDETAMYIVEMVNQARFTNMKLSTVLTEMTSHMGFKEYAPEIQRLFSQKLQGNASLGALAIYTDMSGFIPRATSMSSMITGWVIPAFPILPPSSITHLVPHVPPEMWQEAMEIGFNAAWKKSIRPYMETTQLKILGVKTLNAAQIAKIDGIRHQLVNAYVHFAYTWLAVGLGYGAYKTWKLIEDMRSIVNDTNLPDEPAESGNPSPPAPPPKITKEKLNKNWEKWLEANPDQKPGDEKYDNAHDMFFDEDEE